MISTIRILLATAVLGIATFNAAAAALEPLVGTWQLDSQKINGQPRESERLTLRVSPDGSRYAFSFSVPVNNIDFVSMSYTARLDGREADVKNAHGDKVGTIQITESQPSHYKLILKGANRPQSSGQLTVAADGKILTSESDSSQAGHLVHLVQVFSRH